MLVVIGPLMQVMLCMLVLMGLEMWLSIVQTMCLRFSSAHVHRCGLRSNFVCVSSMQSQANAHARQQSLSVDGHASFGRILQCRPTNRRSQLTRPTRENYNVFCGGAMGQWGEVAQSAKTKDFVLRAQKECEPA